MTKFDLIDLKERIARCRDFSPAERDLILNALNLGDYRSAKREYPSALRPGSSMIADAVWGILDQMRPDAMTVRDRFILAALMAGAFDAIIVGAKR
jgi:hypothetical protein